MTARFRFGARLAAAVLVLAAPAAAGAACSVSAQGVAFGNYDPLGPAALDGVGNVHVSCDILSSFVTVSLSAGGGTFAQRRMSAGAAHLNYNLYREPSRQSVWGEGFASVTYPILSNLDLPVYGRIPALQNVPANVYLDSIVVTITY